MRRATRRGLVGAGLAGGIAIAATVALSPAAVLERMTELAAEPLFFAALLVAVYLLRPVVFWPISAISLLVGFVYGPTIGIPVALVGAVGTCVPPFVLARYARDSGLTGSLGARAERLVDVTGGVRGVAAGHLAPLPVDPVSYAAGMSAVSPRQFVLGTALGEVPWVVAAVVAGSSMRSLSIRGADAGLPLVVGAAALAALVVAGPAYRHLRGGEAVSR
jgi:uncharacterized membrane protein YdjX (TVP38/TMEM64 family)